MNHVQTYPSAIDEYKTWWKIKSELEKILWVHLVSMLSLSYDVSKYNHEKIFTKTMDINKYNNIL